MTRTPFASLCFSIALASVTACGANNLSGAIGGMGTTSSAATPATATPADASATGDASTRLVRLSQEKNLCLGVEGASATAGSIVTVGTCSPTGEQQSFTLDANGLLHLSDSLCVSAGLDPNAPLSLATCSSTANEQVFAVQGSALVSSASALCLAPNVATATDGTRAWMCACDPNNISQQWAVGDGVLGMTAAQDPQDAQDAADAAAPVVDVKAAKPANRATVLSTVKASSMTALTAKVPSRLKAQMANIKAAAATFNLQPQLLVAIAMQESTGGADANAYANNGGMFQFTNADTWREFGTKTLSDRQNDALSVTASANYLAFLINAHNGSLAGALREYNGPVGQGGLASYVTDIFAKMRGNF